MYIVAATGGLEEPAYKGFVDRLEAVETFNEWSELYVGEPGERVDLLMTDRDGRVAVVDYFVWDGE